MRKSNLILSVLLILSSILFIGNIDLNNPSQDLIDHRESPPPQEIKVASYSDITHIYIDGNSDWATLQTTYDWCSGSGSFNDPYIILEVNISNSIAEPDNIHIENSNVYFRLENITTSGNGIGINLTNVGNGTIYKSNISSTIYDSDIDEIGISLNNCSNITISHNSLLYNTGNGINISNSNSIKIENNIIGYNPIGIKLSHTNSSLISNNHIRYNTRQGIGFYGDNYLNNITKNTIELTGKDETSITGGEGSIGGYNGIYIYNDNNNNNTFWENIIRFNYDFGIILEESCDSRHNLFYNNTFTSDYEDFSSNALDYSTFKELNKWNNSLIGNLWDDYIGYDFNHDGIGDVPYNQTDELHAQPSVVILNDSLPIYNWKTKWKENNLKIDELIEGLSWEDHKDNYSWCEGTGIYTNPYHINNVTFINRVKNAQINTISILNSRVYFIINNSIIKDGYIGRGGINLENTTNGLLINNEISNNHNGIDLNGINNITISHNMFNNNEFKAITNNYGGMNNTIIDNNNFINNSHPMELNNFNPSHNVTITNNNFTNGAYNYISRVSNLNITNNSLKDSFETAFFVTLSQNLHFIGNNFSNSNLENYATPIYFFSIEGFEMRNNYLENHSHGCAINYCNNGTILNNRIFNIDTMGMTIDFVNNTKFLDNEIKLTKSTALQIQNVINFTLKRNIITNISSHNIKIQDSENLLYEDNEIYYGHGMEISSTLNITIYNNIINQINGSGMIIQQSENVSIKNNIITETHLGCINVLSNNYIELFNNTIGNLIDFNPPIPAVDTIAIGILGTSNYNVSNNRIFNTHFGIIAIGSDNCVIDNNEFENIYNTTIYLGMYIPSVPIPNRECYDINITNNRIINGTNGIILELSENIWIYNNTIMNFEENGILVSEESSNNIIENNTIKNNSKGIYLSDLNDLNIITNNLLMNNTNYGLLVAFQCDNNLIYKNNFTDNGINAEDYGSINDWYIGSSGNYWDDYTGIDDNDDGIGDSEYSIGGVSNSEDKYPIWTDGNDILGMFNLSSNVEDPDDDGKFTLSWTESENSVSYSIYYSKNNITDINDVGVTLYKKDITILNIDIDLDKDGEYYFVIVAINKHNTELLSNNILIEIDLPEELDLKIEPLDYTIPITLIILGLFGASIGLFIFFLIKKNKGSIRFIT
jgi:parallel beta-helix repeat protein